MLLNSNNYNCENTFYRPVFFMGLSMIDLSVFKKYCAQVRTSEVFYNCFRIHTFCAPLMYNSEQLNTSFLEGAFEYLNLNFYTHRSKLRSPVLFSFDYRVHSIEFSFFDDIPESISRFYRWKTKSPNGLLTLLRKGGDLLNSYNAFLDNDLEDDFEVDSNGSVSRVFLKPECDPEIRMALIKEDPEFFAKLYDYATSYARRTKRSQTYLQKEIKEYLVLFKLYLKKQLVSGDSIHIEIDNNDPHKYPSYYLNNIEDKEFLTDQSEVNLRFLSDCSSWKAMCGYAPNLSKLFLTEEPAPYISKGDLYWKYGIVEDENSVFQAYEYFFRGEFEKCLKLMQHLMESGRKKTDLYVSADAHNKLLELFSKVMIDTLSNRECAELDNIHKIYLTKSPAMSAAAFCVIYLNSYKQGRNTACLSILRKTYSSGGSKSWEYDSDIFIENMTTKESSIFSLTIIAMAVNNESSYRLDCEKLLEKFYLDNIKTSFPALAKRIYNSLRRLVLFDYKEELELSGFYDFATQLVQYEDILQHKLSNLRKILKIDNQNSEKAGSKASSKSKHMAWIFGMESELFPTPSIVTMKDENKELSSVRRFNPNDFFTSKCEKPYITQQDKMISKACYEKEPYCRILVHHSELIKSLAEFNHPYVYVKNDDDTYTHLTFEKREPWFFISRDTNANLVLSVGKGDIEYGNVSFTIDSKKGKLYFHILNDMQEALISELGDRTTFPESYLDQIVQLGQSNNIIIKSDIVTEEMSADPLPVVLFENHRDNFVVEIRVKPVDDDSCPYKIPGQGEETVFIYHKDSEQPVTVVRNLKAETEALNTLLTEADVINLFEETNALRYYTEDLSVVLRYLEQLKNFSSLCKIKWKFGKKIINRGTVRQSMFNLSTDLIRDHINIQGNVELSDFKYITLRSLLDSIDGSSGDYIALDDENYVSITADLKQKLQKIKALTVAGKNDTLIVHPLAGKVLEDVTEDLGFKFSDKVTDLIKKRSEAMNIEVQVPKALNAQLRTYQEEGFTWLYRLSQWGVGACLADDMGLGKTVQTIALMLMLANNGPIMVVAPTSVCPNWKMELNKFAPSLNVIRLKEAEDRISVINSLVKGDVLIVSYGLFALMKNQLSKAEFELAIYDEAQALKNAETKRAKSAIAVNSKMTVALTGTPIENNLDDLWSIFNIINPGLLGTLKDFHSKFSNINNDKNVSRMLKLLISPFILRRLKGDVLQDLPPRTEQVIYVEPDQREQELYEALRRKTAEELGVQSSEPNGKRRLMILAALTKMRQFCCDPGIFDSRLKNGDSSKTQAFEDLLDEALSGGHRLLIFSQFVSYLTVIRDLMERKKISYQYLDGKTSEKMRAASIEKFQSGEGDVFLISLKAGGQGLNLTGADYVVHLDPWWNPAVEDQATDRAYRIGQTRPVNVFRLVIKGSLEEKILELHAKKRELAADFLEGTSEEAAEAMKLSEEELLALIG